MLTKDHVIEKLNTLPEDILKEVEDFIDFLEFKSKEEWHLPESHRDKIEEADFKDYLEGLTNYEEMLAKGEISWK